MRHYLTAELWRTLRRPSLYALEIFTAASLLLVLLMEHQPEQLLRVAGSMMPSIGIFFILLLSLWVFAEENQYHILRNSISWGYSRSVIYFGKLLTVLLVFLLLMAVLSGAVLGICALMFPAGANFAAAAAHFFRVLMGAFPLWIAAASLAPALLFNTSSGNFTAVLYLAAFIVPAFLLAIFLFPDWFSSLFLEAWLWQLRTRKELELKLLLTCWGTGTIKAVIYTLTGWALFHRKEIN